MAISSHLCAGAAASAKLDVVLVVEWARCDCAILTASPPRPTSRVSESVPAASSTAIEPQLDRELVGAEETLGGHPHVPWMWRADVGDALAIPTRHGDGGVPPRVVVHWEVTGDEPALVPRPQSLLRASVEQEQGVGLALLLRERLPGEGEISWLGPHSLIGCVLRSPGVSRGLAAPSRSGDDHQRASQQSNSDTQ
jgi:hypothetical protein